jgi:TupA-like ATPgrasp
MPECDDHAVLAAGGHAVPETGHVVGSEASNTTSLGSTKRFLMSLRSNAQPHPSKPGKLKDELFPIQESRFYRFSRLPVIKNAFKCARESLLPHVSLELTLALFHLKSFGYLPNLRRPNTFNEKLQWKKLYDRRELLVQTADKFAVRDYVRANGLERILIPLLWHGTDPKAIPFKQLPERFVVKPNHLSGAVIIVRQGRAADTDFIQAQAEAWMAAKYHSRALEWAYQNIEPRILVEEFISCPGDEVCPDYKFFCFHGQPRFCQVDMDRFTDHRKNIYDLNWHLLPVKYNHDNGPDVPRPANLDDMLCVCRILSKEFDFVRVDLYSVNNNVFFGELTHYPAAGGGRFNPPEFDREMGSYWRVGTT